MFRQPPNNEVARQRYLQQSEVFGTATRKLVKTKKAGVKRRKKTRDQFARERKAEEAFKFGETRSGLSGRKLYRGAKDIDKRKSAYRPDRLLAIHQSSLNNQARDLKETQMGLTSVGTTLGLEKAQLEAVATTKKSEEMKVKLFSKIIDRLDSPNPLVVGYSNHRVPDGLNSGGVLRLPDRPPTDLPHGSVRLPDSEGRLPTQQGYRSHRKPDTSLAPLILETGIDLSRESSGPTISEIGSDSDPVREETPTPRPTKPRQAPQQRRPTFQENLEIQRRKEQEIPLTEEEQQEARFKIYQGITKGLNIKEGLSTATATQAQQSRIAPVLPTAQIPPPRTIEPNSVPNSVPEPEPQPQPQPPDLSSIESKGKVEEVDESEDSWDSVFVPDREEQISLVLQSADNNYKLNPTKQHFKLVGNFAKIGKGKFEGETDLVIGKFKKGLGGVVVQRGSITNKGINPQTKGNEASVAHAKLQKLIDSGEVRVEKISSDYSI